MSDDRRRSTVGRVRRPRFLYVAFTLSFAAFVVGTLAEGFWGGSAGETNWVDQSFGLAMWAGGALSLGFAFVLVANLVIARMFRLVNRLSSTISNREGKP